MAKIIKDASAVYRGASNRILLNKFSSKRFKIEIMATIL